MGKFSDDAKERWGSFRKFIAAHPLKGFWIGVVIGVVTGWLVGRII